jgi:hypothetical protein
MRELPQHPEARELSSLSLDDFEKGLEPDEIVADPAAEQLESGADVLKGLDSVLELQELDEALAAFGLGYFTLNPVVRLACAPGVHAMPRDALELAAVVERAR